ncbi:MAG: acetyltransferase [Sedimenticola sp.]|nr:acetyltransferase [Sedimenticola sp.]
MKKALFILGAGGHGRVAADCAVEMGDWERIVFLDDNRCTSAVDEQWAVLGSLDTVFELAKEDDEVFVGIGDGKVRNHWIQRVAESGLSMATLIHPRANVSRFSSIGDGSIVAAGACVNIGAVIGPGCIVNTGATVDHDCTLGACVHVCPGANIAGNVGIEEHSWIGIGSCIKQDIHVGKNVIVGAGSVVISDIQDGKKVAGSPASSIGENAC